MFPSSAFPFCTAFPSLSTLPPQKKGMEKSHHHAQAGKGAIWDCDSALYDSFELKSFKRQLDSAIAARTYSMPRLSDPAAPPPAVAPKKPSKVSKSIHRLLRRLFRAKPGSGAGSHGYGNMGEGYYGLQPRDGALSTIPEACEKDAASSPELRSVLRKSVSERFAPTAVAAARISCP